MQPAMAQAAATDGLARWVRAPGPWRPTKLRLDVETQRCPGATISPLAPTHKEQPGLRHSKPASRKVRSSPSRSAALRTSSEPGTTQARTLGATRLPCTVAAASRRSSMRPLVHEPMKTRSMAVPAIGCPAARPMYSSACAIAVASSSLAASAGSGTRASSRIACSGVVPQVICAPMAQASICSSRSKRASGSVARSPQEASAWSHCAPRGAKRRPFSQSKVTASGAIMPMRAPISMLMLHRVCRPAIDSRSMTGPAYSTAKPVPAAAPSRAMIARIRSFASTPGCSSPVTVIRIRRGRFCTMVWVASTCTISLAPIPQASAPSAPWVLVWLSPQSTSEPGSVRPSSGPMMWTIPWPGWFTSKSRMPLSLLPRLRPAISSCAQPCSEPVLPGADDTT